MDDAQRSDLPCAIHPPQDRSVVTRFDGLNGALSSKRPLRPSCSWPLFAPHLKYHKLSIERRVVAVYINDVVMRRVVAPAPRRVRFHHLRNSGSDRLPPHQLTEWFQFARVVIGDLYAAVLCEHGCHSGPVSRVRAAYIPRKHLLYCSFLAHRSSFFFSSTGSWFPGR